MYSYKQRCDFSSLLGKTLVAVDAADEEITFRADDGSVFVMAHEQDCCEHVYVESIVGDMQDLIGSPITLAEESSSDQNPADAKPSETKYQESFTWTFYKLATIKGYVDIRWYGGSNGYYSESVDLYKIA